MAPLHVGLRHRRGAKPRHERADRDRQAATQLHPRQWPFHSRSHRTFSLSQITLTKSRWRHVDRPFASAKAARMPCDDFPSVRTAAVLWPSLSMVSAAACARGTSVRVRHIHRPCAPSRRQDRSRTAWPRPTPAAKPEFAQPPVRSAPMSKPRCARPHGKIRTCRSISAVDRRGRTRRQSRAWLRRRRPSCAR